MTTPIPSSSVTVMHIGHLLDSIDLEPTDMLPVLLKASESMKLGDLIHSNEFRLELATHALEIMNPKLDSRASGEHIYTPEQIPFPEDSTLTNLQILKIIDKLLCYEVSWLDADPLALSLFSCMYLHIAERLKNEYFSFYVNTLLISCDSINLIVQRGDICCEEDFNLSTQGLNLINTKNDCASKIFTEFARLEKKLNQLIKDGTDTKIYKSILNRLTFRKLFHSIVFNITQNYCQTANKTLQEIEPVLSYLENDCYIKDEIELQENIFNSDLVLKLFSCIGGKSQEKPFPDTIKSFRKFFKDLSTLFKMPLILESSLEFKFQRQSETEKKGNKSTIDKPQEFDVPSMLGYLFYFSKSSPNIIARSVLRRLLFPSPSKNFFKLESLGISLKEWMYEFGIPHSLLESSKAKDKIQIFINNLSQALLNLFTYLALNRARQRRKLKNSIYELSCLQSEADILDTITANDPLNVKLYFGSFIFSLKLKVMQHFLFLGFELEVYSPHELYQVYFYLDYFFGIHLNIFTYIFKANHIDKPLVGKKSRQQQQKQLAQQTPTCERILLTATHLLVRAMFRFLVILKKCNQIKNLNCQFSSDELRFKKKFEPFFNPPHQQPDPLPMERVRDSDKTEENWASIAITTLEILDQAKLAVETIKLHKNKIGKVTTFQEEEADQLRRTILRLNLTIKRLLPSGYESLKEDEISNCPIPSFKVQIQTEQYFPSFGLTLDK